MKKINTIIIVALASILLLACDDFITKVPEDSVSVDLLYETDQDYAGAVVGAYRILRNRYNNFWQFDLPSDDVLHQWASEDTRLRLDQFTFQDNEGIFQSSWQQYYELIFRTNTILSQIEDADITLVTNKDQHIGEAKFLRAFAYFDLVRLFGDVPMITNVIGSEESRSLGREEVERIYNEVIIIDLLEASNLLPERYTGSNVGRATKGAALAILGRVYLTDH